jgi:hypothetical protein
MRFTRPSERPLAKLLAEASALEDEHGPARALQLVRDRILQADRNARRHLYRLHDEIARRHDLAKLGLRSTG